jgi:hypothetical protein
VSTIAWTSNGAEVISVIEKARRAQQEHEQKHDVQLELDNPPRDGISSPEDESDRKEIS